MLKRLAKVLSIVILIPIISYWCGIFWNNYIFTNPRDHMSINSFGDRIGLSVAGIFMTVISLAFIFFICWFIWQGIKELINYIKTGKI